MLFWGLKKRELKLRIFSFALLAHMCIIGAFYLSYMLLRDRILTVSAATQKKGKKVTFAIRGLSKHVVNTQNSRDILQAHAQQALPESTRAIDEINEQKVILEKSNPQKSHKKETKQIDEQKEPQTSSKLIPSYTRLLDVQAKPVHKKVNKEIKKNKSENEMRSNRPSERGTSGVTYSKIKKDMTQLQKPAEPEKKSEEKTKKQKNKKESTEKTEHTPMPVPVIPEKAATSEELINLTEAVPDGNDAGELHIGTEAPSDGTLLNWETELVHAITKQLVLPAGFTHRERLYITVSLDLQGNVLIHNETGCSIPAVRAIIRKFFKNYNYPADMRGKQRTFVIL